MTDKTIAITGGTGLLGAALLARLRSKGYCARVLVHRQSPAAEDVEIVRGDVCDAASVSELVRGCSALVHLAGVAHIALRSQAEQDAAEAVNVGGTRTVLAAARAAGLERVIVTSSAHVYAGQVGVGLREDSATSDDYYYPRAKLRVEAAALEAAALGGTAVSIIRPSLTYGPGARYNLEYLMRAIQRGYYFHIRGVRPLRSLLSTGNAAAGIAHLLRAGENGRIYNLADREPVSLVDFANSLAGRLGVRRPVGVPMGLIRAGAAMALPLRWAGVKLPVDRASLQKLTDSFTLDVSALAATGFQWLGDEEATRDAMVDAYLAARRA